MYANSNNKYLWLDASRFVAAYLVVISHSAQLIVNQSLVHNPLDRAINFVASLGLEAVIFFFLLSGFWICRSVAKLGNKFSWTDYLAARLGRLWIVAVPALLSGMVLDSLGSSFFGGMLYGGTQGTVTISTPVTDQLTPFVFICNIVFLQNFACHPFGSNGPLWSLAFEFWFYLAYPAFWLTIKFRRPQILLVLPVIMGLINPGFATGFLVWLLGGAVQWAETKQLPSRSLSRLLLFPSILAAVGAILFTHAVYLGWHLQVVVLGAAFAQLILCFLKSDIQFPRRLGLLANWGALFSFSLYATHFPLLLLTVAPFARDAPLTPSFYSWMLVFALTVPPIFYAFLFSQLTEKRTGQLRQLLLTICHKIRDRVIRASGGQ